MIQKMIFIAGVIYYQFNMERLLPLLPVTHRIISEHLHQNVKETLGVELNKNSLIYGSIKPDIAPRLLMMDHFKPQSFDIIMNEVHSLSQFSLIDNPQFIKYFSTQIGIVTHFIADFFCVPHNDRRTYKNNFINHVIYESNLHKQLKEYNDSVKVSHSCFNVDNITPHAIKNVLNCYHKEYSSLEETAANDIKCSLHATTAIALYIVYNSMSNQAYSQEIAYSIA